jgi:hypothetical protein
VMRLLFSITTFEPTYNFVTNLNPLREENPQAGFRGGLFLFPRL